MSAIPLDIMVWEGREFWACVFADQRIAGTEHPAWSIAGSQSECFWEIVTQMTMQNIL